MGTHSEKTLQGDTRLGRGKSRAKRAAKKTPLTRLREAWRAWRLDGRGITTSEFWMSGVAIVSTLTGALFGALPHKQAAWIIGGAVAAYTISRGIAKTKQ